MVTASVFFISSGVFAASAKPATQNLYMETIKFDDGTSKTFHYQTGTISALKSGTAELVIPEGFKYLPPKDVKFLMEDLYGNDPADTLGVLLPVEYMVDSEKNPRDYFIDMTWNGDDGYISDEDASSMDYAEVLKTLQSQNAEMNKDPSIRMKGDLLGWAETPNYDKQTKTLYFAKNIKFEWSTGSTLNYNIQFLGRRWYIEMNVVTDIENLQTVKKDFPALLGSVKYKQGEKYEDYDSSTDLTAKYGMAGLLGVAGTAAVAQKTGILLLLVKFGKFLFLGLLLLIKPAFTFIKGLFTGGKTLSAESVNTAPTNTSSTPMQETTEDPNVPSDPKDTSV